MKITDCKAEKRWRKDDCYYEISFVNPIANGSICLNDFDLQFMFDIEVITDSEFDEFIKLKLYRDV